MTRTSASPVVLEWLTQAQRGTGVGSSCRAKPEGRRGRRELGPARRGGPKKPPSETRTVRRGTAPQAMPRRPQPVHGESESGRMPMHTRGREGGSPPGVAGHRSRPPEMRAERRGAAPQAKPRRPEPVRGESEGRRMHMYTQEREDKAASRDILQPGGSRRVQAERRQPSSMPVQMGQGEGRAREINLRCAEARRLMQAWQGTGEAGTRGRSPLSRARKCRRERKQLQ